MLNRRYLRIKVMQALYAFFQSDTKDLNKSEKEMLSSAEKIYDLYIYLLLLIVEIRDTAAHILEEGKQKLLPSKEDLNPNTKFIDNRLISQLADNPYLKKEAANRKLSWQTESELVKKIFSTIKASDEYNAYMHSTDNTYVQDKAFIFDVYRKYIEDHELLAHFFEEKSIYWVDDLSLVNSSVIKTMHLFSERSDQPVQLLSLYKDTEEDKQFIIDLFRKTIINDQENEKFIAEKTKNWEIERIAVMDILLMKMAITEILNFPSIPVKVTLNEYIEISKLYSTPKSKVFINGILDKLVVDFKQQNKIHKSGRGLME